MKPKTIKTLRDVNRSAQSSLNILADNIKKCIDTAHAESQPELEEKLHEALSSVTLAADKLNKSDTALTKAGSIAAKAS